MKIHILSDLHIEFGDWIPPRTEADVVVLAGDIFTAHHGLAWARRRFPRQEIIYVLGNHEFYGQRLEDVQQRSQAEAARLGVNLLECGEAVIDGVRFLGATLWTDFEIAGDDPQSISDAMWLARRNMSDFGLIRLQDQAFRPEDSRNFHLQARGWLKQGLDNPFGGKTVVVTHHLPHLHSIDRQFFGDPLNPCFASHLPELVRPPVDLWIHGHTHCSCDYEVEGVRVVCNPRGYAPADLNPDFRPDLVVEV